MIYFTPGPTEISPIAKNALADAFATDICSLSHRSSQFREIVSRTHAHLRHLFSLPSSHDIFFLASATEAFERILQNTCAQNSYHFIHGAFSERFFSTSQELGKKPQFKKLADGQGFDLRQESVPHESELVCITHNETSTGVCTREDDIHHLARQYPDKLFAVDMVSSAPFVHLDWSLIDMGFFSVQKCFGLPAGLGVLFVSERAREVSKTLRTQGFSVGSYHSFKSLSEFSARHETPETPNVLAIYLLEKVCANLVARGLNSVEQGIHARAKKLYDLLEKHPTLSAFVKEPQVRSNTVITCHTPSGASPLLNYLKTHQIEIGGGYGKLKDQFVRIANFPSVTDEAFDTLVDLLKAYP